MKDTNTTKSDLYICEAFKQILTASSVKWQNISPLYTDTITYLAQLPQADKNAPDKMANHITSFCEQPGNETLYNWLGKLYDNLDQDGINKLVKKTGDPGSEADDEPEMQRLILQKSRDICQELEEIVKKEQTHNNS